LACVFDRGHPSDGLDRWFPVIESCRVEGQGVGAIGILGLGNSGEMRDRIEEIDDQDAYVTCERITGFRSAPTRKRSLATIPLNAMISWFIFAIKALTGACFSFWR
jgi:hypothetical protein